MDLEAGDALEEGLEFVFGQDDHLVTAVGGGVADADKGVDVVLREEAEGDLGSGIGVFLSPRGIVCLLLEDICYDVAVRDLYSFLIMNVSKKDVVFCPPGTGREPTGRPEVPLE